MHFQIERSFYGGRFYDGEGSGRFGACCAGCSSGGKTLGILPSWLGALAISLLHHPDDFRLSQIFLVFAR